MIMVMICDMRGTNRSDLSGPTVHSLYHSRWHRAKKIFELEWLGKHIQENIFSWDVKGGELHSS